MRPNICILVSTFERQVAVAQLTRRLLDRFWNNHPPIWICGVSIDDEGVLPLHGDGADWMVVMRNAIRELIGMGFEQVYLILDDQGPLEPCHEHHLNHTIPAWMAELDAVYISIRGWDHRRNSAGRNLGKRFLSLQQQCPEYKWRFALHPALWRIDVLARILDILMAKGNGANRSAWAFEIGAGSLQDELPGTWNEGTYRVCGRLMSASPILPLERWTRHLFDGLIRWTDKKLFQDNRSKWSPRVIRALDRVLMTQAVYYQGPYPMHFSGFLVRGRLNQPLVHRLRRLGHYDLLQEIEMACTSK